MLAYLGAGKTPQAPAQSGYVETWKPSTLVPNTSRLMIGEKEELPLRAMQADVRIDGFCARVLLDLYYYNDRPRQFEGSFQLRLPEEASPYFFAFGQTAYQSPQPGPDAPIFFKPDQVRKADTTAEQILAMRSQSWLEPKAARIVPREKAAAAYRDTVRRRVDPALAEWSGAGVFQCRVFPLAPQALHRIVIGYDVNLVRAGKDLELRLDLPEKLPACVVDLSVAAPSQRQISLDAQAEKSSDGLRLCYRLVNPKQRPLSVRLHEPGTMMLAGSDAVGSYFAARLQPDLPAAETRGGAKRGDLSARCVAQRAAADARLAEAAPQRAGEQPRSDRAVLGALLQRGNVLVAGTVRAEHAGKRRGPLGVYRRTGPGRRHGPRPGPGRRHRAGVVQAGPNAAVRLLPPQRRRDHLGRRQLAGPRGLAPRGGCRAAVRLHYRNGRHRGPTAGPPGRAKRRSGVLRGRRCRESLGHPRPTASAPGAWHTSRRRGEATCW